MYFFYIYISLFCNAIRSRHWNINLYVYFIRVQAVAALVVASGLTDAGPLRRRARHSRRQHARLLLDTECADQTNVGQTSLPVWRSYLYMLLSDCEEVLRELVNILYDVCMMCVLYAGRWSPHLAPCEMSVVPPDTTPHTAHIELWGTTIDLIITH